jgi:hypothetical protein
LCEASSGSVDVVPVIDVPVSRIYDWDSFHDTFATALGFPSFYGRNMDAWIDCLTYRDEDDGMAAVVVAPGDVLTLQLDEGRVHEVPVLDEGILFDGGILSTEQRTVTTVARGARKRR